MDNEAVADRAIILSYLGLRKAVGIIGMALPFVLAIGGMVVFGRGLEPSVSAYYHSPMRDIFVGSLCAIGVFLCSYNGYERSDVVAGLVSGIAAFGVALFPTTPADGATASQRVIGTVHLISAACFFLTLAYFCLVLFRKTRKDVEPTARKTTRNKVYFACGVTILACLVGIVVVKLLPDDSPVQRLHLVFWFEAIATVVFGLSWLTKGEAILKDVAA